MSRSRFGARRTSRRGKRGFRFGKLLKWAGVAAVPATALGVGVFAMQALSNIEREDANFCLVREGQPKIALLIDYSIRDQSGAQVRDYQTGMMAPFDRAPANALIEVFTTALDAQSSLARPVFTICKPAVTAEERKALHAPDQTPQYLRRQADDARARYERAVDELVAAAQDDAHRAVDSPILEMVQAVSRYDGFQGGSRSLTILTDGLQMSELAQFCIKQGDMPSYAKFEKGKVYPVIKPKPLTGVDVTLLLVEQFPLPNPQMPYCTSAEMRAWWPAFFEGNGAASVELHRIRLGAGT